MLHGWEVVVGYCWLNCLVRLSFQALGGHWMMVLFEDSRILRWVVVILGYMMLLGLELELGVEGFE